MNCSYYLSNTKEAGNILPMIYKTAHILHNTVATTILCAVPKALNFLPSKGTFGFYSGQKGVKMHKNV